MRRILVVLTTMVMGVLVASGVALATVVSEVEPNDEIAAAQDIDGAFDLTENTDITDSTAVPHATVNGTGETGVDPTHDYYKFTVPAGTYVRVILDIDHTTPDSDPLFVDPQYDPIIELYDSSGTFIDTSDDAGGDPGSTETGDDPWGLDSSLYKTLDPGTYYVGVGSYPGFGPVPAGSTYQLHVSVGNGPNPPDTTITDGPAEGSTENPGFATFNFSATEDSSFECSLDGAAFESCDGPITITGLSVSAVPHTFRVRATDDEGNVDTTPASRTWTVSDATAPTIQSTTPADGATRVSRTNPNITATFSEEMTLPAGSFTLQKVRVQGQRVTVLETVSTTVTVDQANPNLVRLALGTNVILDKNSYYRVTLTTAATDEVGNPLQSGATWRFKTAPR